MIEIGQVTPPVGLNLSVLVSVTKEDVSLGSAAIATMPYWLLLLVGVATAHRVSAGRALPARRADVKQARVPQDHEGFCSP